jgi:hypothetical protein
MVGVQGVYGILTGPQGQLLLRCNRLKKLPAATGKGLVDANALELQHVKHEPPMHAEVELHGDIGGQAEGRKPRQRQE